MRANVTNLLDEGIVLCPSCRGDLRVVETGFICQSCDTKYLRSAGGTPLLLTSGSLFTAEQVLAGEGTYYAIKTRESKLKRRIRRALPSLGVDLSEGRFDGIISKHGLQGRRGLVVGSGERVGRIEERFPHVEWTSADVDLSYGAVLAADATELPFADSSFEVVIAEMVLEHVVDICAAANEIQRVCAVDGLVAVTIPFCFPWHGVPFDFFRCTPSGLRALFRFTDLVYLGIGQGPGSALAYSADAFLVNSARRRYARMALAFTSRFAFGWLKFLDRVGARRGGGAFASAGSLTYIGMRRESKLQAPELVDELQAILQAGQLDTEIYRHISAPN